VNRKSRPEHCVEIPPKQRIARAFGLKAQRYDSNAVIQTALLKKLLNRFFSLVQSQDLWADLGCGTGLFSREIRSTRQPARIIGLDLALEPLLVLKKKAGNPAAAVQADIEELPFKDESLNGAVIASVLQWLENPGTTLRATAAKVKPGGSLLFAGFVRGSFAELFSARASFGLPVPANLPGPETLRRHLAAAGFAVLDLEIVQDTLYFASASALLKSISLIGGTAVSGPRLGRHDLAAFCRFYEQEHITDNGIPLTWRAMICACRKGMLP
jgi:malonyl-CoA O-methyltransferase